MINAVKRLFRLPTPREYAERKLEEHQRELIEARRVAQSATTNVMYHERVVADLRRTLQEGAL